jgi:hypothetical protein
MTLAIGMLNDIFPCILNQETNISSIPMCYAKCHVVNNFPLRIGTYANE